MYIPLLFSFTSTENDYVQHLKSILSPGVSLIVVKSNKDCDVGEMVDFVEESNGEAVCTSKSMYASASTVCTPVPAG